MDGKACVLNNVIIERLWCTVKHNDNYIRGYQSLSEHYWA